MKEIFVRTAAASILCMLTGTVAYGLPAKPGLIKAGQPDGSTITIRLEGNEHSHRAYTSDGYLLTNDAEGFYVFADCDASGNIVATTIRDIDPERRSAETTARLAGLNHAALSATAATQAAKAPARNPGLFSNPYPSKGENRALAILVEFKNRKFSINDPADFFSRMLNEEGFSDYNATGSARDYFIKNSHGLFKPQFDVYGPVTLDENYGYYGANSSNGSEQNAWRMVVDGCAKLAEEVDFSLYDANGDGDIDNVYVFYAGYGEADGGNTNTVWPHSWDIRNATMEVYEFNGKRLNHYACSNELQFTNNLPDGIGSFVHEFGHVMGLPDLYMTGASLTTAFTPGKWDVMDVGSYNNYSHTPPVYSSYERYALEWLEPEILSEGGAYELPNLADSNFAYMIETASPNEFYLLENRQQSGYDSYIPGHGMLVWHIDFDQRTWDNNIVNNNKSHQYVDIVEADNKENEATRSGDTFPGKSKVTSFTATTKPALLSWGGEKLAVELYDIEESEEGMITFTAEGDNSGIRDSAAITNFGFVVKGNSIVSTEGTVIVYDLTGRRIAVAGSQPVELPAGLYVITSNGKTSKILIM